MPVHTPQNTWQIFEFQVQRSAKKRNLWGGLRSTPSVLEVNFAKKRNAEEKKKEKKEKEARE